MVAFADSTLTHAQFFLYDMLSVFILKRKRECCICTEQASQATNDYTNIYTQ